MHITEATSPAVLELDRKKNGIFYTPLEAANILCKWAIRSPEDYVIEPGFGGCGFLKSSLQRLSQLNCDSPSSGAALQYYARTSAIHRDAAV